VSERATGSSEGVNGTGENVTGVDAGLRIAVADFAAQPRVLVAVDFDGTLSPLIIDPLKARAVPGALEALRAAAALGGVTAAIVSGRDLATLRALTGIGPEDGVALIGSHGAQTSFGEQTITDPASDVGLLDKAATAQLNVLRGELEAIRSRYPAVRLEEKPSAVALHTRGLEPSVAAAAEAAGLEVGSRYPDVHVIPGKNVVELTLVATTKGGVLLTLAESTGSDATLYVGDDVTDESAFAALDPASGDLTVKVGDGQTLAAHRVPDPESVVRLLDLFVDQRRTLQPGIGQSGTPD
jgi:trehalose 6-phosphate phosphatase